MLWYQSILRVSTSKLVRMIIGPSAFAEKPASQDDMKLQNEELYGVILPIIDKKLARNEYICGSDEITISDV